MTDTPFSPSDPADDDLLASLYLDGEATAEQRAQVERDPELLARVEMFRSMATDLSDVTPPPDLARMQIGAALDLFDEQVVQTTTPVEQSVPTAVTSLADRRQAKRSRGIPTWLGAAAALALVVGGLGFASSALVDNESDDTAAMDASTEEIDPSSRTNDGAASSAAAPEAEMLSGDDDAMDDSAMDDDAMDDSAMEDDSADGDDAMDDSAMEDDAMEEGASEDSGESDSDDSTEVDAATDLSPIPLDDLEASSAAEYYEQLLDQPLQPIADSPCAASPLVEGLFGVDSFLPVVFNGELGSLLVQDGVASTAVIVGPACTIELN